MALFCEAGMPQNDNAYRHWQQLLPLAEYFCIKNDEYELKSKCVCVCVCVFVCARLISLHYEKKSTECSSESTDLRPVPSGEQGDCAAAGVRF